MPLTAFLKKIKNNEPVSFDETLSIIKNNYDYTPTEFSNGPGKNKLINAKDCNEGSCKIFAFAEINQLNQQQTLMLFGGFYRKDVLENPEDSNHQNIRNFMQYGWESIRFTQQALKAKKL